MVLSCPTKRAKDEKKKNVLCLFQIMRKRQRAEGRGSVGLTLQHVEPSQR